MCSQKIGTSRKAISEISLYFLHFTSDLDTVRCKKCPQQFVGPWRSAQWQLYFAFEWKWISLRPFCIAGFGWNSLYAIWTWCCWAFVSFVKIGCWKWHGHDNSRLKIRSSFLTWLSRRAQSGRWSSFGKRMWFTESNIVLVIFCLFYLLILFLIWKIRAYQVKKIIFY